MTDDFEEKLQEYLNTNEERATYVKAESIDTRAHLLQMVLSYYAADNSPDQIVEICKRYDTYVKYGA